MTLKSCCCFDLKTGTLIFGILALIGACINITILLPVLVILGDKLVFDGYFDHELEMSGNANMCDAECKRLVYSLTMAVFGIVLLLNVLSLMASSLLVHGVRKQRPGLLTAYLIKVGVILFFTSLALVGEVVLMMHGNRPIHRLHSGPHLLLSFSLSIALLTYVFHVVKSCQTQMRVEQATIHQALVEDSVLFIIKG